MPLRTAPASSAPAGSAKVTRPATRRRATRSSSTTTSSENARLLVRAARASARLPAPPVDPGEHFGVPLDSVGGLEHPVVLVREVDELARNAAALEQVERPDPLRVDDAVVESAVD